MNVTCIYIQVYIVYNLCKLVFIIIITIIIIIIIYFGFFIAFSFQKMRHEILKKKLFSLKLLIRLLLLLDFIYKSNCFKKGIISSFGSAI